MGPVNIALVGVTVVFLALIALFFAITLFSKVLGIQKHASNSSPSDIKPDSKKIPVQNEELIAVLAAAVRAAYKARDIKTDIRVRSFRRINGHISSWKSGTMNTNR